MKKVTNEQLAAAFDKAADCIASAGKKWLWHAGICTALFRSRMKEAVLAEAVCIISKRLKPRIYYHTRLEVNHPLAYKRGVADGFRAARIAWARALAAEFRSKGMP